MPASANLKGMWIGTEMLEAMGWLGDALLAACGLPQAIASYRQNHSHGLSIWFLLMWLAGEVLVIVILRYKLHPGVPLPGSRSPRA